MKILLITFLVWFGSIRAELEVINTTLTDENSKGCLQSGRLLQGLLAIPDDQSDSLSDVPPSGICPSGTILIGPSVLIRINSLVIETGLRGRCAISGLVLDGLAQSAQPLIPLGSNCSASKAIFLSSPNVFQTVKFDNVPWIPELAVNFTRSNEIMCTRSGLVIEGYLTTGENLTQAINESCPRGQFLVKRGVILNQILLNSSKCIQSGVLSNGRVFIGGEVVSLGQNFSDQFPCDFNTQKVLRVGIGVIIFLELPPILITSTVTSTIFSSPPASFSTLYSTFTSTVYLTRTRAYPSYHEYESQQQYRNYYGVPQSMIPSGYAPKRDRFSFKFGQFDNKAKTNMHHIISAKIKKRLGNY